MGALPAISADTLGNRSASFLPPLVRNPGTPADRQAARVWLDLRHRDPPAQPTANVHAQCASFTNAVYIAVRTIMTALSGAEFVVLQRRSGTPEFRGSKSFRRLLADRALPAGWRAALAQARRDGDALPFEAFHDFALDARRDDWADAAARYVKSTGASSTSASESEWAPAPADHPLTRLLTHINEIQSPAEYLAERLMVKKLSGMALDYVVPGEYDPDQPKELWVLRPNLINTSQVLTDVYPSGAYRYMSYGPSLWSAGGLNFQIPREQVLKQTEPHPLWPWAAFAATEGGAKLIDFLNSVVDSRKIAMDEGFTPDVIVEMAGASQQQMDNFLARIKASYVGQHRGRRVMPVDTEQVKITTLNMPPDHMAYPEGYDQGTAAVLALFGVPAEVAFLAGPGSYSSFYAAARAFREMTLGGELAQLGSHFTKHLARRYGDDLKIEVKLPPLMDPDQKERQWQMLNGATGVAYKLRELRSAFDMPPMEDDDLTPDEYKAKLQQKMQPPGLPGMGGMPGADTDPIAALLGNPNAEPAAPGDVDNPEIGGASAGSLPGKVGKGLDLGAYFDRLVAEVVA